MAYIKRISFAHVGRTEGCTCDKCGTYIQNIVTVDYTDGITLNYGQDCFDKMYKSGRLNEYGLKLMRKALKSIETHSKELAKYVNGEMNAENDLSYQCWQNDHDKNYWKGRSYEEYRNWMIDVWFKERFKEDQKKIDRFAKVNFNR